MIDQTQKAPTLEYANQRLEHVTCVLKAIRKVNQLIKRAGDRDTLLEEACHCLTETRGYFSAWIVLFDHTHTVIARYESGLGDDFCELIAQLESGRDMPCVRTILGGERVCAIENPAISCGACFRAGAYSQCGAISAGIVFKEHLYGVVTVATPAAYIEDDEERALLAGVAEDLGWALHNLAIEKAHARVSESLHLYRSIISNSEHPMTYIGTDYRLIEVNAAYGSFFGVSAQELAGMHLSKLHGKKIFDERLKPFLDRCLAGEDVVYEFPGPFPHKGYRWVEIYFWPHRNDSDEVIGIFGIGHDITEIRQQKREAQAILETVGDGFWRVGTDGRIREVNTAAAKMLGYSKEELTRCHISDIDSEQGDEGVVEKIEFIKSRGWAQFETRHRCKDGRIIDVAVSTTYLPQHEGEFVAFLRDITVRKEHEKDMEKIAWMNDKELQPAPQGRIPYYGDVTELNRDRTIRDSVGLETLEAMGTDLMRLLDTSVAVYEKNGDYAYGCFVSQWCSLMDGASRRLCDTDDNQKALSCGQWLCHENCWNHSAKAAIQSGKATDIQCVGGIHLYCVPVFAGDDIVGAINIGYGDPPRDMDTLAHLAAAFAVDIQELTDAAAAFKPRPAFIVETAKARLHLVAGQIGQMVENHRARQALVASESRYRRLSENSPAVVFQFRMAPDGTFSFPFVTKNVHVIMGVPAAEIIHDSSRLLDMIHRDDRQAFRDAVCESARTLSPYHQEIRTEKQGATLWLEARSTPELQDDGSILWDGFFQDITEKKSGEQALRDSERRVRMKLDTLLDPQGDIGTLGLADLIDCEQIKILMNNFYALTHIGVGILDLDGTVLVGTGWQDICTKFHRVNRESAKNCLESDTELSTGVAPGTFKLYKCKNGMWDMVTPIFLGDNHVGNLFLVQFLFDDENPDIELFRTQAKRYGFNESAYLDAYRAIPRWSRDTVTHVMTFYSHLITVITRLSYTHITLAQLTENLRKSESNFRTYIESAPEGIFIVDSEGKYTDVNKAACEMTGFSRSELLSMSISDLQPSSDDSTSSRTFETLKTTGEIDTELMLRRKNGPPFSAHLKAVCLGDGRMMGFCSDITERKRVEEALRKSESLFQTMFSVIPDMISIHDPHMNIVYSNWNGFAAVPEEKRILGTKCYRTYRGKDERCPDCEAHRVIETGEAYSQEVLLPEGRWVDLHVIPILGSDGACELFVEWVRDVTERKETDNRIRQMHKMDAIGQLAGGVAHDFNNQLAGIMGYADMLQSLLKEPGLQRYTQNIIGASRRAADLTRKLLAFSRQGQYQSTAVDIHEIIQEVVDILNHSVDKRIEIHTLLDASPSTAKGDATQIQNALLNLAINACDAMPDGGRLSLESVVVELNDEYCANMPYELVPGLFLRICVSDTGSGIPRDIVDKIFEPFFTTKEVGKGTGMGLAAVYGTVKHHGGAINVYSEVGHGTTFRIYLPLGEQCSQRVAKSSAVIHAHKAATILVVDDEEMLRDLARDMLSSIGYTVVTAENGKAAIEYFTEHSQEIDLVVLDMVMPVMSGKDAYLALKEISPSVKVLLASGYSINGAAQGLLATGVQGFLQKPYDRTELSRMISQTLGT